MIERAFQAVYIKPTSPSHFGERGVGVESVAPYPHSDTIFSAICNAYLQLFGVEKLEDMLAKFEGNPPFLISSTFPYCDKGGKVRFFPKPLLPSLYEAKPIKELKELTFLSESAFKTFMLGGVEGLLAELRGGRLNVRGKLMVSENESQMLVDGGIYKVSLRPRNRLSRLDAYSEFYYVGETRYPASGMFFLIELRDGEALNPILQCFKLLSDEGIGGKRSLGYGRFTFETERLLLSEAEDADALLTLSLYHPTEGEVQAFLKMKEKWHYKCLTRTGYVQSPKCTSKLKHPLRMLMEGSVFPKVEGKTLYGDFPKVLDEADQHPVYRYGYALTLGVKA